MECLIREAIDMKLHPNNMNRERGFPSAGLANPVRMKESPLH
jgi:hypothetical protein